ncbi:MAG: C39 family peptidase [Phycisphaerales bacterium]
MTLKTQLYLDILPQPDDTTCGPTCLHAVYRYYGDERPLTEVIAQTKKLRGGGTLAVMLAEDALRRGYDATIFTYNLRVFDPTWFDDDPSLLPDRLRRQLEHKPDPKLRRATKAYLQYLEQGGRIEFADLTTTLIRRHLKRGTPLLTGLSATYLYHCAREIGETNQYDDIRGEPSGHFVVICGYDADTRKVNVADPLYDNPAFSGHHYEVPIARLVGAILLGVLTYDANFLLIEPKKNGRSKTGATP